MKVLKNETKGTGRMRRWKALTQFRTHIRAQGFSLIEVQIRTGVTHQIRAHLQAIGHPLVGDSLYGGGQSDPFGLGRQFLHASYLGFLHPKSAEAVAFESPLPRELRRVLDQLGVEF
jgi:23S rRNA pseudouridine1911/1915/1917 synthase